MFFCCHSVLNLIEERERIDRSCSNMDFVMKHVVRRSLCFSDKTDNFGLGNLLTLFHFQSIHVRIDCLPSVFVRNFYKMTRVSCITDFIYGSWRGRKNFRTGKRSDINSVVVFPSSRNRIEIRAVRIKNVTFYRPNRRSLFENIFLF